MWWCNNVIYLADRTKKRNNEKLLKKSRIKSQERREEKIKKKNEKLWKERRKVSSISLSKYWLLNVSSLKRFRLIRRQQKRLKCELFMSFKKDFKRRKSLTSERERWKWCNVKKDFVDGATDSIKAGTEKKIFKSFTKKIKSA